MEFKLSKIQETLEKSRRVLMESLELRPTTTKSSFMDRFNYGRCLGVKRPESKTDGRIGSEIGISALANNSLPFDLLLMNPQSLELERKKIQMENEILMRKLQNPQERCFGVERSANVSRNMTPTPVKAREIPCEMKKKCCESSLENLRYLREKVRTDEREKLEGKETEKESKENSKESFFKYKMIVEDLEKQLRCVTKKYEKLRKDGNNKSFRDISAKRPMSKKKSGKSSKKVKREKSCVSHRVELK